MVKKLNERVKKMTIFDIKLMKLAVFFAAIIVVKLFPRLLEINFLVLIIFMVACIAKPFYAFWLKR